jgi:hypothetical protein
MTAFNDVFVFGSNERRDGEEVRGRLSTFQDNVPDTTNERLNDVLHAVELFLRAQT